MQQLTLVAPRKFEWWEVPDPVLRGDVDALVSPIAVASCDLEPDIINGHTGHGCPMSFGHEFTAKIVKVGDAVSRFKAGDIVAVAFQISCGTCGACSKGLTASCERVPSLAAFGLGEARGHWGGALSDLVRVPFADAMCVHVPHGLDPVGIASASDNIADAHRNVAGPLLKLPGAPVLIVAGGYHSIGLYTVEMAKALGSAEVTYADHDPARLALAQDAGAKIIEISRYPGSFDGDFPVVVNCSGTMEGLHSAIRSTANNGTCTNAFIFWGNDTPFPLAEIYLRSIDFRTARVNSRVHMEHVISLAAAGRIRPQRFTQTAVSWDAAADALSDLKGKTVIMR